METKILQANDENIRYAAEILKKGDIVAFPTETVYGLGADGLNAAAAAKVFVAKDRPATNPLILHVASKEQIEQVAHITDAAQSLIDTLMPGALTLVLKKKDNVPSIITAGTDTVAVRMPDHPVALGLIAEAGVPICAPSANTSARPSPTNAQHVYDDLCGRIPLILDGGRCPLGLESTIVDLTTASPRILRAGAVEPKIIEQIIGKVNQETVMVDSIDASKRPEHSVPKAEIVFSAYYDGMYANICREYDEIKTSRGKKPVILCQSINSQRYGLRSIIKTGDSVEEYARVLFEKIREAEKAGYTIIIAEGVPIGGIGTTLLSRLMKLSGGVVI